MALAASFSILFIKRRSQALKALICFCREIKEMKGFFRTMYCSYYAFFLSQSGDVLLLSLDLLVKRHRHIFNFEVVNLAVFQVY